MEKTSGSTTEDVSLYHHEETGNRCRMYRKEQTKSQFTSSIDKISETNYNVSSVWNQEMTEMAKYCQVVPNLHNLHCGDLEEGRPHKIISSKTERSE